MQYSNSLSETLKWPLAVLIAVVSYFVWPPTFLGFVPYPTAFEWPTADVFFALERAKDPHFLIHDFFTNSSSDISPRTPYMWFIIALTRLLQTDYYTILFVLKTLLVVFLPVLVFWMLAAIPLGCEDRPQAVCKKYIILAIGIAICQWPPLVDEVQYAIWRPLPPLGVPQGIAYLLVVTGWLLFQRDTRTGYVLGSVTLFVATLIHGANTIFVSGFMLLASTSVPMFRTRLILVLLSILPAVLLADNYFGSEFKLPSATFIELYIKEAPFHRHHYLPEVFHRDIFRHMMIYFGLLNILAFIFKYRRLSYLGLVFWASYAAAIALQSIVVNYIPSRSLALLGPVRYAEMGYFMLVLLTAGIAAHLPDNLLKKIPSISQTAHQAIKVACMLACIALALYGMMQKDDPKSLLRAEQPQLFNWIETHTKPDDVFSIPLETGWKFQITTTVIAKRAVYYAGFMAFNDKYIVETMARKNWLYGSYKEWNALHTNDGGFYCHILDTKRIRAASQAFPLQWMLMANECVDKRLDGLPVAYKDARFTIFHVVP